MVFSRNALLTIRPETTNIARRLIFGMSTHVNIESTYVKNYGSSFFRFPVINTCHIFGLKHVNLTVRPKKVNEARGLILGIKNHIYMISIHAKYHRSSLSHFLVINTSHVFFVKNDFFDRLAKKQIIDTLYFLNRLL